MLPDVGTMIERLAARLKTSPDDAKGWRMLGWSYFYTERYKEAVTAYARAVELDPTSADLKLEYEEAKEKTSEGGGSKTAAAPAQGEAAGKGAEGPTAEQISAYQAMPPHEREVAIRSMVDGLAARLENSPRDVEGWMRLMRSRVVLGESEIAAAAFRKALSIFKDDTSAASRIRASAFELGLKAE
ncbi:tetratricopeptide repeat protein [Hyphomicrobium sp. CS1BSMeth3]|uniref:tetratricopeptide repeat protein n=1 Tax=Hyphomicrobium sp. CS1BSMeth3 TaxID=1892844 RepID=UPI0015754E23|nr:tetratricopeptide repeat protein [Hyphomicrobium sp. CS1BSMeth3]